MKNLNLTAACPGIAILLLSVLMLSCEKEGPVGPEGPAGPRGEQGDTGPKGAKGDPGTANVIYSEWIPIDWNVLDANTVKRMDIDIPQITAEFLENGGIVLFFVKSADAAFPVPMSRDNYSLYFLSSGGSNEVRFIAQRLTGLTGNINVTWVQEVRYILIPGGMPIAARAGMDLKNYQEVKTAFNLRD